MKSFLLLFLLLSCSHLTENDSEDLLVRCGHLLDPVNMTWLKDQSVLIRKGKVVELNPAAVKPGTKKLDYSEHFVIPGLVDAHSHVFLSDPTMGLDFSAGLLEFIKNNSTKERLKLGEARLNSLARSGFTTVRDLGNMGSIKRDELPQSGAKIYSSGPGFTPADGQFPPGTKNEAGEYLPLQGSFPEDFSFDLLKLYADEEPNPTIADQKTFTTWVRAARAKGLIISAHGILHEGIKVAIAGNADTIEHGTEVTPSMLHEIKRKGIIFVPTYADVLFLKPKLMKYRKSFDKKIAAKTCHNIRTASRMGVKLAFGSDNYFSLEDHGIEFGDGTLEILLSYKDCGLSPLEILRIATSNAGETISRNNSIGKITPGGSGDFIVLKENPEKNLEALKRPVAIYMKGKKIR